MEKLLRPEEFAETLGLSVKTVRKWIYERRINCVQIGRKSVRIPFSEIERLVKEGRRNLVSV